MSSNKATVQAYMAAFHRSDHAGVLACLTDDVEWLIPGMFNVKGRTAFDKEIENDAFVGSPTLIVDRLIEEADTVVSIGSGETTHTSGERHRFAFCDAFTFAGDAICRVESYVVPLREGVCCPPLPGDMRGMDN